MHKLILAGVAAGAALGAGVVGAIDLATPEANAQRGGDVVTQAQLNTALRSANQRASAAINGYKTANNVLTKYFIPEGQLIGTRSGPIRQDRGTGANGLPTETIQNLAITNQKLANESVNSEKIVPGGVTSVDLASNSVTGEKINSGAVTGEKIANGAVSESELANGAVSETKLAAALANKLPRWITKTDNGPNTNGRFSSPEYSIVRIGAGNYRADFGDTNISQCSWNAVPSVDLGLPTGREVLTALDATDNTRLFVLTLTSAGALVESGWQAQVFC